MTNFSLTLSQFPHKPENLQHEIGTHPRYSNAMLDAKDEESW